MRRIIELLLCVVISLAISLAIFYGLPLATLDWYKANCFLNSSLLCQTIRFFHDWWWLMLALSVPVFTGILFAWSKRSYRA